MGLVFITGCACFCHVCFAFLSIEVYVKMYEVPIFKSGC